ncbi:MAG: FAD-dependent oxidoreductase [Rhodospirillales bacterium]|nr:MAG: FAD-dependent oxidoreductase [Rhodospirillales bacterium]
MAVVGSGVAGLGAAWLLSAANEVVVYEKEARLGGHSNTVDVPIDGRIVPVDTGFIVFNEPNYPNLVALLDHIGVATHWSDMSFAVSLDGGRYEYGSGWLPFVGQPANVLRPRHWRLLGDILRFNREAPRLLTEAEDLSLTLGGYLAANGYPLSFAQRYLVPMAGCIWSAPMRDMLAYPAQTLVRFFSNHGLLRVADQLRWRTVAGGSRAYVEKLAVPARAEVRLSTPATTIVRDGPRARIRDGAGQWDSFDAVVVATHGDQALTLLDSPSERERSILGSFRYARNHAVLHADAAVMPTRRAVWSSWNYVAPEGDWESPASLTYWMNRLQGLDPARDLFVSLNPSRPPRDEAVFAAFDYEHPLFDRAALEAQRRLPEIQGTGGIEFCGSYCGYGFHEDALAAGLDAAERLGARRPWPRPPSRVDGR